MQLRKLSDKYEFDGKFYLIALLAVVVVGAGIWYAKVLIDRANGREVQNLIHVANLDTRDAYKSHARNYLAHLRLKPPLQGKAEELVTDAMYERVKIWTADRAAGVPIEQTRARQDKLWRDALARLDELLRTQK
jgi:hypothetical protein